VRKVRPFRIAKTNCRPTTLPRAMQARINKKPSFEKEEPAIAEPAKGVAVKIARKKESGPKSSQSARLTRSIHRSSEDDQGSEDEANDEEFIVDDLSYKSKRKSKVGAMARSNLFAGLR